MGLHPQALISVAPDSHYLAKPFFSSILRFGRPNFKVYL